MKKFFNNWSYIRRTFRASSGKSFAYFVLIVCLWLLGFTLVGLLMVWVPAEVLRLLGEGQSFFLILMPVLTLGLAQLLFTVLDYPASYLPMAYRTQEISRAVSFFMTLPAEKMNSDEGQSWIDKTMYALYQGNEQGIEGFMRDTLAILRSVTLIITYLAISAALPWYWLPARGLYKGGDLIILDEPTAALDPLAEAALYQEYLEFTREKTSIFISHRLSSTQFCDRILYLQNGCLVQQGSHDGLLAQPGPYRDMFETQASYYREQEAKPMSNNAADSKQKQFFPMLAWLFRTVHAENRNFLPLYCLSTLMELVRTYLPILLMAPLLQALLDRRYEASLKLVLILAGGIFLSDGLHSLIEHALAVQGGDLNRKLRLKMHLHNLDLSYQDALDQETKQEFATAMANQNYEMGNFDRIIKRCFSLILHVLSFALALSLSLKMLVSRPGQATVESSLSLASQPTWLLSLAQPLYSLLLALGISFLAIWGNNQAQKRWAEVQRKYLQTHGKVESDLRYFLMQFGLDVKNYAFFQSYNIFDLWDSVKQDLMKSNWDFFDKGFKLKFKEDLSSAASSVVILVLSYGLVGIKVLSGAIALASLVTYVQSFNQLSQSINKFASALVGLRFSIPYLADMRHFVERENDLYTGSIPVEKRRDYAYDIKFDHVSFRYPGTEGWALRDINLEFTMRQKHALVGPNGSGKTTLILLLCRLYEPTEGRILLNGVDIKKYNYQEYLDLFSVVFQDYQLFAFSLGENVACQVDYDGQKVEESLLSAGLPREIAGDLDQLVADKWGSQEFFSGGEQQKIAIARALYKPGSLVVLDEPTAALDPQSEAEIYAHLNDLIEDKTTVFISHRMSSCRFCEDILVLDQGQLVERGRHAELLSAGGLYSRMWQAQAQYYQD